MKTVRFKTENEYLKLKHLPFNREYGYRNDLAAKMNEYGFVGAIIIIDTDVFGKQESYIADGQNRAATASRLGIEFQGAIVDHAFKSIPEIVLFVASLNSTQKAWNPVDYVKAYVYLNFKDYLTLIEIKKTCPFTLVTVANMLYGYRSKGSVAGHLKQGTFVCNQLEETKYTLVLSAKLSKVGVMSSRMVTALHYVASMKNFNESKFTVAYTTNYKCIKELNLDDYSDIFASWLN